MKHRLRVLGVLIFAFSFLEAGSAQALPALQLGPGGTGWTYDASTQTWVTYDSSFQLAATANATTANGGNGDYAWASPTDPLVAYLVISAMPQQADPTGGLGFDITVSNGTLVGSGFGAPPILDPNSLAPHSIFDTYYEIYEFTFNPADITTISDTQPGGTGTGMGYLEFFDIGVQSLAGSVDGLHFDLYTLNGSDQVEAFAPFSHDAQFLVPEPHAALLFGVGGLIAGMALHRRR